MRRNRETLVREAHSVVLEICVHNDLSILEKVITMQYFAGIEPDLIISKVNTLNSPLLENAMCNLH